MNPNSNAILTLCSHLCVGEGIVPLEPKEYGDFAQKLLSADKKPCDLLEMSRQDIIKQLGADDNFADRIMRLVDRNASLCFELEKLSGMGIEAVTRADKEYPAALKKKLLGACPPIFYCAGDLELLNNRTVGFVGSRAVEQKDAEFTKNAVNRVVSLGYGVVSGGAKGIDTIAGTEAILRDSFSIEYVSDSMLRKLKSSDTVKRIQDGKLLMLSVVRPDAGFNVGIAMQRNRYIYAQSEATVVVRADLNKGGTWSGATENLRHSWCPTLCWDYPYPGNKALIEKGAVAIGNTWDGSISTQQTSTDAQEEFSQISLFE